MSDYEVHWAVSIFFLAYLIFEIPSNVLMRYLGLTSYLSLSMISCGSIAVGMAFVTNARELMIVRALLGMAQSGYFPGIIIYISWWYCKKQRTMRLAIVFTAAITANALNGLLAYCFTFMKHVGGLKDWQWMFLLESAPIIPLGIVTWLFLDNIPNTVRWLKPSDQQTLTNCLLQDAGVSMNELTQNRIPSCQQIFCVFNDWRIYMYAVIAMGNYAITKYLTAYLPSLVHLMGYRPAEAHLLAIPPYTIACISCLLVGYSSSRRNEHVYHLVSCLLVALVGFVLWITLPVNAKVVMYISTCIACCGMFSAFPLLLSWLTNAINGRTETAMAISFIMGIGQIGGIVLPLVYDDDIPNNRRGKRCRIILKLAFRNSKIPIEESEDLPKY
ncbi:unnamed protein product [Adineta steineri]|uniref:Major facilitator superfamily (MFS) profile domain-containing protein n=1 Tax=Adineta steineri TaxID=433720 RepID=A0A819P8Z9_9BILA|nr:unnamed protein product [Adineta steineri]